MTVTTATVVALAVAVALALNRCRCLGHRCRLSHRSTGSHRILSRSSPAGCRLGCGGFFVLAHDLCKSTALATASTGCTHAGNIQSRASGRSCFGFLTTSTVIVQHSTSPSNCRCVLRFCFLQCLASLYLSEESAHTPTPTKRVGPCGWCFCCCRSRCGLRSDRLRLLRAIPSCLTRTLIIKVRLSIVRLIFKPSVRQVAHCKI
mmetsp:Transcript_48108/g.84312  ORF Transcript_48108/g.84312 Transcript_48108/m.84312 type:complete len:204 (-) Transcript_48108:86-697(-)